MNEDDVRKNQILSTIFLPSLITEATSLRSSSFWHDVTLTIHLNMLQYYNMFIVLLQYEEVKMC